MTAPKTMIASVELVTSEIGLDELARVIGIEPDPGSRDKGDAKGRGGAFEKTCLKLFSEAPEQAPLGEHVKSALSRLETRHWESIPTSVTGYLVVAVLSDGPTSSLQLDSWICEELARRGLYVEVVVYVADEQ